MTFEWTGSPVVLQGVVIGVTSGLLLAIFQLGAQFLSRKIRAGQQARKVIACYTEFQEQILNPTELPKRVIKPAKPDPHHDSRMAVYRHFQGEMDRLRMNETDSLSHKQKEELFEPMFHMNDLLGRYGEFDDDLLECDALPIFKEILEYAAGKSYIKRHGFRLAEGEGGNP